MNQVTPQTEREAPASRRPLFNVGTALALAVVISLLAFLATSSGESPVAGPGETGVALDAEGSGVTIAVPDPGSSGAGAVSEVAEGPPPADSDAAPATTIAPEIAVLEGGGGGDAAFAARSSMPYSLSREITNMGPTEVWFSSNFPLAEYTWERIELSGGDQADISWLGEMNGMLIAVSSSWDTEGDSYRLVTNASEDGIAWQTIGSYKLPRDTYVNQVTSDGARLYAFAQSWGEFGTGSGLLLVSSDGATWSEAELALGAGDGESAYVQAAVAGPAGLAVAVSFESYPEQQPVVLEFDDINMVLDYMRGTYQAVDPATGEELMSGSTDEIFNWSTEDGQPIWNVETGELIITIPFEIWEKAFNAYYGYGGASPLPFPVALVESEAAQAITIEYGGYVVTIDEMGYEFSVTDAESGTGITSGSLDDVYQGPPPRLVDPETGETLLSVTWDEWYQAEEMGYRDIEEVGVEYRSRLQLLTSSDGEMWDAVSVPGQYGAHVYSLIATDNGFVAMVNSYGELGDHRSVWTMEDGEWTSADGDYLDLWLYQVARTDDGFIGVGDSAGGPALWSSRDGVTWNSEFAIVVQSDGSYASFADATADDSGIVAALARRELWSEYKPLIIEKDGYTLTFEDGETLLTVTDASGVVLSLTWLDFEEGATTDFVTWEDAVTYIDLGNGDVIAIPDEDAYAAMGDRWSGLGSLGLSVFLREGGRWSEAIVTAEGGLNGANQVYLFNGKIIIAGTNWDYEETAVYEGGGESSFVVIVGTPKS